MKEKDFSEFENKRGIKFNDQSILKQAFTHRSFLNENKNLKGGHNERLEFLGDAVLELATTDFSSNHAQGFPFMFPNLRTLIL